MTSATLTTAETMLSAAADRQLNLKALGGIGCWLHADEHGSEAGPFLREYGDIDVVLPSGSSSKLAAFMKEVGLEPLESFNVNGGATRRMYVSASTGVQVDVFIGSFSMCHAVPLDDAAYAPAGHPSLSATELLLTKLQVVELSEKDANDAAALFAFHEIAEDPTQIDGRRIARILASDWGLWRTVTGNLRQLAERADSGALPAFGPTIRQRIDALLALIDAEKKSMKWRARSKVGDRVIWYAEPEEPVKEWLPVN
jgi:hypothetical protein